MSTRDDSNVLRSADDGRAGAKDESRLRRDLDRFIESVIDYAFVTYDLQNRITGWNAGAERTLGYTESEILGQSGAIFFTPEDRELGEVERELDTARRELRASDERWHIRRDGSRFWASGVMMLIRDETGQPRGYAKVLRDLTDRKKAEDALRASEERLRLFVETVRDHVLFEVDPQGAITSWNSGGQALFGYAPADILGRPLSCLFTPEDRDGHLAERELAQARDGKVEAARWVMRRDGSRFFASWVTHPIIEDGSRLRGFAKVLRDETDRLRAEQEREARQLRERARLEVQVEHTGAELDRTKEQLRALAGRLMTAQEEERRRLARELHDDLSQRLAVLEAEAVNLSRQPGLNEMAAKEIERMREQVTTLSEDVRSISHRLHPSMLEDLGLEYALRALVDDVARMHTGPLEVVVSPLPGPIARDAATTLYRIAQESLRNLVKHAPGARATVRLWHSGDHVGLTIDDDGPGFDSEKMKAQRGLGLVTMEERARLAGGTVAIRTAPGAGTEVDVALPLRAEE